MGWLFTYNSRRVDLIRHLTEDQDIDRGNGTRIKRTCLAKTYKGAPWKGTLYAVFEDKIEGGRETSRWVGGPAGRWIGVFLLQYRKDDGIPMWGYKDMEESCGPYEDGCPIKYLDMVPWCASLLSTSKDCRYLLREDGKFDVYRPDRAAPAVEDHGWWSAAANFRARCRARAAKRGDALKALKEIKPGQRVILKSGCTPGHVSAVRVERGILMGRSWATVYRVRARQIDFEATRKELSFSDAEPALAGKEA